MSHEHREHTLDQVMTTTPNDQGMLPELILRGTTDAAVARTGTGSRGFMDAGIIFTGDRPLCALTAYTEHVPEALPDGTPGFAAACQLMGRMARLAYDAECGPSSGRSSASWRPPALDGRRALLGERGDERSWRSRAAGRSRRWAHPRMTRASSRGGIS